MGFKDGDGGALTEPLQHREPGPVVGEQYCHKTVQEFTLENAVVTKDWSITNADGHEVFRVRGKMFDWCKKKRQLVDLDGNPIVLMESKPLSFIGAWKAFAPNNQEQPLWTMKKSCFCSIGPKLQIFLPSNEERKVPDYTIKGNWLCKKSTIFFGEQIAAEVVRDASLKNVLMTKSIFHVTVQPGVDTAFIFSLIVIMDKLYIHNAKSNGGGGGGDGGGS
jgi:uncharacterized protein YxjI